MKILFVNACVRGNQSRTLKLAETFLQTLKEEVPQAEVMIQDLTKEPMQSVDMDTLARKEALCDAMAWSDPFFRHALSFQQSDLVVIAAPYWDMSFPSILKVWVENMYVRNLTFKYVKDQSVGLCKGTETVYITTAGSPIGVHDWGTQYIRDVMNVLGIPGFSALKAEALDLADSDPDAIMLSAVDEARKLAHKVAARFQEGK